MSKNRPFGIGLVLVLVVASAGPLRAAKPQRPAERGADASQLARFKEGAAAFLAGDHARVQRLLGPLARAPQALLRNQDYLLYMLAESQLLLAIEGRQPELALAARGNLQLLLGIPGSRFHAAARARMADCLFHEGPNRRSEARAAYLALLAGRDAREIDVAAVRFRLAEIESARKQEAAARDLWRRIYIESPLHPLAQAALSRLQELARGAEISAAERLQRARTMSQARRWQEALDELRQIPADVEQALLDEVEYWTGMTHYRMRRGYDVAARKLLGVAARMKGERQADAMFHGARALSRADQDDEAIVRYRELVKAHPGSRLAPEASFLMGWLSFNRARYEEAIPALSETLRRFSGHYAQEARWYLGLSRYLSQDYAAAASEFQALAHLAPAAAGKGRYWAARALLQAGRRPEAEKLLRETAHHRPLSYYALLARVRLRELGIEVPPFPTTASTLAPLPPVDDRLVSDPAIVKVDELLSADLHVEAGYELRRVEEQLLRKLGARRALPLLFDRYSRGQNFNRPHLLAEAYGAAALARDPHKVPAARPYWEQMYPLAYKDLVEKYAPVGYNPPRYLYAIMQKESAYNPHDVSYADAIGLLQMIPPTSRMVAREIDRPYTEDILYDPEGNIHFGSWYIGRLLRKFRGQIAIGAGSYNAGPRAMMRWLAQNGKRPLDEFIELCSYTQTREYMKKVLDIYAHYVYLWDQEDYLPEMRIDDDVLTKDGIDY